MEQSGNLLISCSMENNFKQHFLKNTVSNYVVVLLKMIIGIIAIPIYLKTYGAELYGIFLLAFGLITSLSFLDFGSGKSLIRYTATYKRDNEIKAFSEALSNSILLISVSSILTTTIILILGYFSGYLFHIPPEEIKLARQIFYISAFTSAVQFFSYIPSYILQGWGIFHLRNIYQAITILFQIILLIWLYYYQPPLLWYCIGYCLIPLSSLFLDILLIHREKILRASHIRIKWLSNPIKSPSFSYSNQIFLISTVGIFSSQFDRFIISAISGVTAVTVYSVITRPYYFCKGLFANYYSVIQPEFVKAYASEDAAHIKRLIIGSTKTAAVIIWVILLCCGAFFKPLLQLWVGTDEYNEYWGWGFLALGSVFFSSLFGSVYRAMIVTGFTKQLLKVTVVTTSVNLLISVVLTYFIGWYGVIIGTSAEMLLVFIMLELYGKQLYRIRITELADLSYLFLLCFTVAFAFTAYWLGNYFNQIWYIFLFGLIISCSLIAYIVLKRDQMVRWLI